MEKKEGERNRTPEEPKDKPRPGQDGFEPAPTDFRRNVWILALMLMVVLLAWLLSLLSGRAA